MFFNKSLLAVAAIMVGSVSAFTGTGKITALCCMQIHS
jgi:hypothetical protein